MAQNGQETKRRGEFFIDQHGREYFANIEIKTGDPCETLAPYRWTAPIEPSWARSLLVPPLDDKDIVKLVPLRRRARAGYQVFIDYATWLRKWDEAYEAWQQKLHDFAKGMSGGINLMDAVNNPPPVLKGEVGSPPSPPRAMIEAAAAGNAWALGTSSTVPAKAQALLDAMKPIVTARHTGLSGIDPFAEDAIATARLDDDDDSTDFAVAAASERFTDALADDALAAVVATVEPVVRPKQRGKAA